jgi:hypothetical protein
MNNPSIGAIRSSDKPNVKVNSKTALFYTDSGSYVILPSQTFRLLRMMTNTGIPKKSIRGGSKIYVHPKTFPKIKAIADGTYYSRQEFF